MFNIDRPRNPRRILQASTAGLLVASLIWPMVALAADIGSYRLEKVVTIPSGDSGWDYNSLDQKRGHMFIAHRKFGLHVYDVKTGKVIKTMENSTGTNTSALAAEFDTGIAGTTDGYVILFRMSTLKVLSRYKSTTEGFDGATFDPVTQRFAMVGEGNEETKHTPVLFFDAKSGKPVGSVELESLKVDAPRPDELGNIFLPLRDKATVVKIDAKAMQVAATYPLTDCMTPASLETDNVNKRIFVGCRGKGASTPALAVLDAESGAQLAKLPIGRGVDEVMYDKKAGLIVTANGEDGSMTVIKQNSPGEYRLSETIGTRPMARTGVLDEETGKIYLVNAQYVNKYVDGKAPETTFVPNTFSVLTFSRTSGQ